VLDEFRAGLYSASMTKQTYDTMLKLARDLLMRGKSVILDATFQRRDERRAAIRLARETGAQFACILTEASEFATQKRLGTRLAKGRDPSDARWEIYLGQKRRFQPPTELLPERLITIDTSSPIKNQRLKGAVERLQAISPLSVQQR
jgi:predicted kinase